MNMDLRSSRENTEIGAFVDSKELADEVLALAGALGQTGTYRLRFKAGTDELQWVATEDGHELVYDDEPEVDFGTRMKSIFIAPFISEGLL
jgi:putative cardiolipin synthase